MLFAPFLCLFIVTIAIYVYSYEQTKRDLENLNKEMEKANAENERFSKNNRWVDIDYVVKDNKLFSQNRLLSQIVFWFFIKQRY